MSIKRKSWNWDHICEEFQQSGLTQTAFCREKGVSQTAFRKHLHTCREQTPLAETEDFLPVRIIPSEVSMETDQPSLSQRPIVITIGKAVITIPSDTDTAVIGTILDRILIRCSE